MLLAKVYVTYKESILDPQGETIRQAIDQLGYKDVDSVRQGKYFEILLDTDDKEQAAKEIDEIADQLLANVTMETYTYEIEEA